MEILLIILVVCIIIGAVIGYRKLFSLYQQERYTQQSKNLRFITIKMPRNDNDQDKGQDNIQSMKQNLEVMNQIYKNFYALYQDDRKHNYLGQEYLSCEILVEKEVIKFNLAVPKDHVETFEKHISSFYPGCVINTVDQPKLLKAGMYSAGGDFLLTKSNAFPLKTYENFEVDPMDSILSSFARVGFDETLCFQILLSPLNEKRQKKMRQEVKYIKE